MECSGAVTRPGTEKPLKSLKAVNLCFCWECFYEAFHVCYLIVSKCFSRCKMREYKQRTMPML